MKPMERVAGLFWGRRARKIYVALLILFALFNIAVFFILPPVARSIASKKGTEALSRPVTVERICVNPYTLTLTVTGLRIGEREGSDEFVSFKRLYVNMHISSVWEFAPVISAVYLDDPAIHIIRTGPMTFNFSDLIKPSEPKPPSEPLRFSVNDIQLRGGAVKITDKTTGAEHAIEQIRVSLPSVSNFPHYIESDVQPYVSAIFDGSPVELTGQSRPFAESLQTTLDLNVTDLELPRYMRDVPVPVNFRVDSGRASCSLHLTYTQCREAQPALALSGDMSLMDFQLSDSAGQPVLKLPECRITRLNARPLKMEVGIGEILVREPELNVARAGDGKINLLSLMPPPPEAKSSPEPDEPTAPDEPLPPVVTQAPAFPVSLDLDSLKLIAGKVTVTDEPPGGSFRTVLFPIDLECAGISTSEGKSAQYKFAMRTEANESLDVTGAFSLNPISAQMHVLLANLFLPKYAPYYADRMRAQMSDGSLSVEGDVDAALKGAEMPVRFKGRVSLQKMNLTDLSKGETLVALGALDILGIDASFPPAALSIEEIIVSQPNIQVVRNEDTSINLLEAMPPKPEKVSEAAAPETIPVAISAVPEPPAASAAKPPLPAIAIGKITVHEGSFSLQDRSLSPSYNTKLDAIEVVLQGFAMDPMTQEKPADFNIHAKLDEQSPISISGQVTPNPDNLFVSVRIDFQDVQLSPLTPYSAKFIGYPIDKGRLRLDLQYLIQGVKLDSQNRILLDQFTLGDRVEGSTATKLPIKFAIALLKDRHGQIKFDVPVSGSLDDPKFRVMPIVIQTLVNLITRAVTSPFALLCGGEESNSIAFEYGSATLTPDAIKTLNSIAEALADRPALRFEIRTETLSGQDADSLRKQFLTDILKAEKRRETLGKAGAATPLSEIQIAPEEYERYLTAVYKSAEIPDKPTTFLGGTKTMPAADMEKALLSNLAVTPDDLRRLAYQRAATVRDYMLTAKAADAEHILMTEPRQVTSQEGDTALPTAEFTLQMADAPPSASGAAFAAPPPAGQAPDLPRKSSTFRTILYGVGGVLLVGAALAL